MLPATAMNSFFMAAMLAWTAHGCLQLSVGPALDHPRAGDHAAVAGGGTAASRAAAGADLLAGAGVDRAAAGHRGADLLTALVLPDFSGGGIGEVDLRANYFGHARWF